MPATFECATRSLTLRSIFDYPDFTTAGYSLFVPCSFRTIVDRSSSQSFRRCVLRSLRWTVEIVSTLI